MSLSQLRVKWAILVGVFGTSLLAATLTGCQSGPTANWGPNAQNNQPNAQNNQANPQNAQYGQHGRFERPANGQQFAGSGAQPQDPFAAGAQLQQQPLAPENQQALMAEMQRQGGQQTLLPQDVVAMSRSGAPDAQILAAIQQRGPQMLSTPGMADYLAHNGVGPGVVDAMRQSAAPPAAQNSAPQQFAAAPQYGAPLDRRFATPTYQNAPGASTQYQAAAAYPGQIQPVGYENPAGTTPIFEAPAPMSNAAVAGQAWRPKTR